MLACCRPIQLFGGATSVEIVPFIRPSECGALAGKPNDGGRLDSWANQRIRGRICCSWNFKFRTPMELSSNYIGARLSWFHSVLVPVLSGGNCEASLGSLVSPSIVIDNYSLFCQTTLRGGLTFRCASQERLLSLLLRDCAWLSSGNCRQFSCKYSIAFQH